VAEWLIDVRTMGDRFENKLHRLAVAIFMQISFDNQFIVPIFNEISHLSAFTMTLDPDPERRPSAITFQNHFLKPVFQSSAILPHKT
jgi:hypothetical protein